MEKQVKLNERSCSILLNYFDCVNLQIVMKNKILEPYFEDCLEVYRRIYVCKKTENKLNVSIKTIKI